MVLLLFYEIIAFGIAYALVAVLAQRKLSNMDKMYLMQDEIKSKSDELMALTKQNADKSILEAKQKEVMGMVSQSMKMQLRPMLVVFPLFLIVYYWLLPSAFASASSGVTFTSFNFDYKTLFIVVTFILGFGLSTLLMRLDKKRLKVQKQAQNQGVQ